MVEIVSGVAKMLGRMLGEDMNLQVKNADCACPANVDPGQIEQILMNLAVNARDAMPGGGQMTLELTTTTLDVRDLAAFGGANDMEPGPYIVLSASDTGTGMAPEIQSKIFDPFFTTKAVGEGTGLGLSTVYGIVKQHHGHITVESEPGQGSTFCIYIPGAADAEDGAKIGAERSEIPRGRGEAVLLVEDESDVRQLMSGMLMQLLLAGGAESAMKLVRQPDTEIALMLCDVVMPDVSGPELANQILALRPGLPIIFSSGYPADQLKQHGFHEDRCTLLHKPFSIQELARSVRAAIDR